MTQRKVLLIDAGHQAFDELDAADLPASGAPTDATYLVTTAHAGLSAEVAVGTTPGGELGNTWASPTVDASHSGSTHAAAQAAAEATAASALSAHEADTTSVHGIPNTANLYTAGGTDVAVADGGTGSSTAAGARTNLGLVIGTDVQAQDADIPTVAASQAEMEAGTEAALRSVSPLRVAQAIAALGGAGGGGLILLGEYVAAASATLDIVTRNAAGQSGAVIQSDFDQYLIEIDHLRPANNSGTLILRFSTDGGSTYIATVYQWNHHLTYGAGTTADEGSASDTGILFGNSVASAGAGVWGTARLIRPAEAGTTYKTVNLDTTRGHTSVGLVHDIGIGYLSVAAINAFRFLFSNGNIAAGTGRVYGIVKA